MVGGVVLCCRVIAALCSSVGASAFSGIVAMYSVRRRVSSGEDSACRTIVRIQTNTYHGLDEHVDCDVSVVLSRRNGFVLWWLSFLET